jgi:hypothetical protein
MEPIQLFLKNVKLEGEKQSRYNMALFPLLAPDVGEPAYLVLEEALGQGAVEITEVSYDGSVSDLKAINKSPNKVLVADGEELVGAKQNRIVNDTLPFGCEDLRLKCCIPMENLKNIISGRKIARIPTKISPERRLSAQYFLGPCPDD